MRTIIFLLFFSPFISVAQRTETYLKLVNASGLQLKGDAVTKGFEKWLFITSSSQGGKNNTQLTFTMNISGASADLRKAVSTGEFLNTGDLTTIQVDAEGRRVTISQVKMEKVKIISYAESGTQATVTIQSTRIGWIYYQQSNKGTWVVSNKYSYDAETGGEWKGF